VKNNYVHTFAGRIVADTSENDFHSFEWFGCIYVETRTKKTWEHSFDNIYCAKYMQEIIVKLKTYGSKYFSLSPTLYCGSMWHAFFISDMLIPPYNWRDQPPNCNGRDVMLASCKVYKFHQTLELAPKTSPTM
jgi:hypothetical protein